MPRLCLGTPLSARPRLAPPRHEAEPPKQEVPPCGYVPQVFPAGFSAEWVRVTANEDCTAKAHFTFD